MTFQQYGTAGHHDLRVQLGGQRTYLQTHRSFFCKVLETTHNDMLTHLSKLSLLASRQHGFLPRRLILTKFLVADELVTKWPDEGSAVDLIPVTHRLPTVMNWLNILISQSTRQRCPIPND